MANYSSKIVETNFGCSGVTDYGRSTQVNQNLVSSISLPDGTSYTITYEATPSPVHAGAVTGRIASVTLPTGGTISYQYTGSNNGIVCADGSTAGLKRTTPDSATPWQYTRTQGTGAAWTTNVTDPQGNVTVLNFQGIYETQRQVYHGAASGTPLLNAITCYNNNPNPCTNASNSTAITLPMTQLTVLRSLNGGGSSKSVQTYNSTYTCRLRPTLTTTEGAPCCARPLLPITAR